MLQQLPLDTSFKSHLLVGLFVSFWLVIFLILIGPFDAQTQPLIWRMQVMHIYGLIFLAVYLLLLPIQNFAYRRIRSWGIGMEVTFYALVYLVVFPGIVLYYKSSVINGDYTTARFAVEQYVPILVIITPILYASRRMISRSGNGIVKSGDGKLILRGENKRDILHIKSADLVCVNGADNYVEVHFVAEDGMQKKMLRSTLKTISKEVPELLRVHRSYLINPNHFSEWEDKSTISLTFMSVPVSKKYRTKLNSLGNIRP